MRAARNVFAVVLASALVMATAARYGVAASEPSALPCEFSAGDRAWLSRTMDAWHLMHREIQGLDAVEDFHAVFFDAACVLTSADALTERADATWQAYAHDGLVILPNGETMPPVVTSFTSAGEKDALFVMSTPTVWRAAGVDGGPLGLEALMVAVMLHEGVHILQSKTYGSRVSALAQRFGLPESFGDDSLQERFGGEPEFADSVAAETALFLRAATAADDAAALSLAQEARSMMRARAGRWYSKDEAWWPLAEDVWLTFEGSGQWAGYRWLVSEQGGAASADDAVAGFGVLSRWWSQNQGFAIALALDRLTRGEWKRHAFGDGRLTLLQMLDQRLEAGQGKGD